MILEFKDICKKVSEKYGKDPEYIEFVMNDVFYGIKQIARTKLFVNFWKGISLSPWIQIVVSPRHLLRTRNFEKFCWYKNQKKKHYDRFPKKSYKGFDLTEDRFRYLQNRLKEWLDTTDYTEEQKEF